MTDKTNTLEARVAKLEAAIATGDPLAAAAMLAPKRPAKAAKDDGEASEE